MPIVSLNNQPPKISGSIMQGTPVSNTNLYLPNVRDSRYDTGMLGQITPPSHPGTPLVKESGGSITQGIMGDSVERFITTSSRAL